MCWIIDASQANIRSCDGLLPNFLIETMQNDPQGLTLNHNATINSDSVALMAALYLCFCPEYIDTV